MTKNELLLNMAIHACGWGEGADFEMTELIHEGNYEKWIRKHYPELFVPKVGTKTRNDKEEEDAYGPNWDDDKVCDHMQREVVLSLCELRKPFECPVYKAQCQEKARQQELGRQKRIAQNRQKAIDRMDLHGKMVEVKFLYCKNRQKGILSVRPDGTEKDKFSVFHLSGYGGFCADQLEEAKVLDVTVEPELPR